MSDQTLDVTVKNEGSIVLFNLLTEAAKEWVKRNVDPEPWQMFGGALSVEWRYASNILEAMQGEGLVAKVL